MGHYQSLYLSLRLSILAFPQNVFSEEETNINWEIDENVKIRIIVANLANKQTKKTLKIRRAGPDLPINFENIALNKIQVDKLRAMEIDYDPSTGYLAEVTVEETDEG